MKTNPKSVPSFDPYPKIITNKVKCLKCDDVVESTHRHDFKWCSCSSIAVDGGKDYLKRCGNLGDILDLSTFTDPYQGSVISEEDLEGRISSAIFEVLQRTNPVIEYFNRFLSDIHQDYTYSTIKGKCLSLCNTNQDFSIERFISDIIPLREVKTYLMLLALREDQKGKKDLTKDFDTLIENQFREITSLIYKNYLKCDL